MTPKEKAKKLVDRFYSINDRKEDLNDRGTNHWISRVYAKQCALICVEEVLSSDPVQPSSVNDSGSLRRQADKYWQQVKREIEKL